MATAVAWQRRIEHSAVMGVARQRAVAMATASWRTCRGQEI